MPDTLFSSVLKTVSYFDIFEYPLSREELWNFLWQPSFDRDYEHFLLDLEKEMQGKMGEVIETKDGYYFLRGKSNFLYKRQKKILYTEEKLKIAKRATKKLRYIPFVQALFVCNQLSVGVKQNSDIDVFIIVRDSRMWMTRAFITLVLSLFFLRRTHTHIVDKMCLSFYVTESHLDLSSICLDEPDVYQIYWNAQLLPLYDPENFLKRIQENNKWVTKFLPNYDTSYKLLPRFHVADTSLTTKIKKIFEYLLGGILGMRMEQYIRFLQLQKMKLLKNTSFQGIHKNVIISDVMLKFHENDRKQFFKDEWEKRWKVFM